MPTPAITQIPTGGEASSIRQHCQVQFLGRVPYRRAWARQAELAAEIAHGRRPPTLLLLEHPHTFTLGRSTKEEHLLWSPAQCRQRQIEVHQVDRGGDITYHGPGQLVAYPLLSLGTPDLAGRLPRANYLGYLRQLELVVVRTLAEFGIDAVRLSGLTGVWVPTSASGSGAAALGQARLAKIAAIGVKVDAHGISRHGLALNLSPDMSYWRGIVPCGLGNHDVISLAQLQPDPPSLKRAADCLAGHFGEVFDFELI